MDAFIRDSSHLLYAMQPQKFHLAGKDAGRARCGRRISDEAGRWEWEKLRSEFQCKRCARGLEIEQARAAK